LNPFVLAIPGRQKGDRRLIVLLVFAIGKTLDQRLRALVGYAEKLNFRYGCRHDEEFEQEVEEARQHRQDQQTRKLVDRARKSN